jgi:hypothetical protein
MYSIDGMLSSKKNLQNSHIYTNKKLWEGHKVIASQAFLESLKGAYKFRNNEIITISEIKGKFLNQQGKSLNLEVKSLNLLGNSTVCDFPSEIQEGNTQSKVK